MMDRMIIHYALSETGMVASGLATLCGLRSPELPS